MPCHVFPVHYFKLQSFCEESLSYSTGTTGSEQFAYSSLRNGTVKLRENSFNDIGKLTKSVDPVGRTFSYSYPPSSENHWAVAVYSKRCAECAINLDDAFGAGFGEGNLHSGDWKIPKGWKKANLEGGEGPQTPGMTRIPVVPMPWPVP